MSTFLCAPSLKPAGQIRLPTFSIMIRSDSFEVDLIEGFLQHHRVQVAFASSIDLDCASASTCGAFGVDTCGYISVNYGDLVITVAIP